MEPKFKIVAFAMLTRTLSGLLADLRRAGFTTRRNYGTAEAFGPDGTCVLRALQGRHGTHVVRAAEGLIKVEVDTLEGNATLTK